MAATADLDALSLPPGVGSKVKDNHRVNRIRYGDGLSQRASDGLNANTNDWLIIFDALTNAQVTTLRAFLDPLGGHEAFLWTPPGEVTQRQFTTISIDVTPLKGGQNQTVKVLTQEEFDL